MSSDPTSVLLTLDFSPLSEAALDQAVDLARRYQGTLHLLTVIDGRNATALEKLTLEAGVVERKDYVANHLAEVAARVPDDVSVSVSYRFGLDAADEIVSAAEAIDPVLIVMASHGRTGVRRVLVGSVTESVMRQSRFAVVVVPVRFTNVDSKSDPDT